MNAPVPIGLLISERKKSNMLGDSARRSEMTANAEPITAERVRSEPLLPLTCRFGTMRLAVTDRDYALAIWRDIVGLELLGEQGGLLRLGTGSRALIELETKAQTPVKPNTTGLYHVALHLPERADLARFVLRAADAGLRIAPTDHLVTEAVYAWDSDGNGIEMTFETPWRGYLADPGTGSYGITADGRPHSGREPIDLNDLLSELDPAAPIAGPLPPQARIGHVHVHVNDLDDAMRFYRDVIGFGGLMLMRDWGMGDAGLDYMPHAIAFNIWAGRNAPRPPQDSAGLRWFTLLVPDEKALQDVESRLKTVGENYDRNADGIETADPSGNRLRIALDR